MEYQLLGRTNGSNQLGICLQLSKNLLRWHLFLTLYDTLPKLTGICKI